MSVGFTMPAEYSMADLPVPNDLAVSIEALEPLIEPVSADE